MVYVTHTLCFIAGFSVIPLFLTYQMIEEWWMDRKEYKKKCDDYHKNKTTKSLGDALPEEIKRVMEIRDEYLSIGPSGMFAASIMMAEINNANKAMISGDVVAMLRSYNELKSFEL